MASDSPEWLPKIPEGGSLPDKFSPEESGVIGAMVAIVKSGFGATLTALAIGLAAIPAGFVIGVNKLLGGAISFLEAFIGAFFGPFQIAVQCGLRADCKADLAFRETSVALKGAGLLGFFASILVLGALMYAAMLGVRRFVG